MLHDILIIDDDIAILTMIADILRDEGYAVRTATNGAEGLTAIDAHEPALILMDMRMPVLDGWGVARALRERKSDVPVIVMTAAQDTRWGQEIGAAYSLTKPFDLFNLLRIVGKLLLPPSLSIL